MSRVDVAVGVLRDKGGRVLITRRKDNTHQGSLWEFPGGKFERLENDSQALDRELLEELNISPEGSSPLIKVNFDYPDLSVQLHVREVHAFYGEPVGREGQACKWVTPGELSNYSFPAANKAILVAIKLGRDYAIVGGNNVRDISLALECVAKQGVGLVQIRAKDLSKRDSEQLMESVRYKCSELKLNYLLNSQMPVKRYFDEGVHLASFDLMKSSQRPEGAGFMAASCHNLQELRQAEQLALDFVVLSPVMQTSSHPEAKTLGWPLFAEWVAQVNIPVFALGGIGKQDYEQAITCGAQGISGISLYNCRSGL